MARMKATAPSKAAATAEPVTIAPCEAAPVVLEVGVALARPIAVVESISVAATSAAKEVADAASAGYEAVF